MRMVVCAIVARTTGVTQRARPARRGGDDVGGGLAEGGAGTVVAHDGAHVARFVDDIIVEPGYLQANPLLGLKSDTGDRM
jgi:hypothetical protein